MYQRLQKLLSAAGIASRREAEGMINDGRITVDGRKASLGDGADPEINQICLDGEPVRFGEDRVYLMLNKPRGYVTTLSDEKGRPCVAELVAGCRERVYPIGRLDMDSEGLLLFTNDGAFANRIMHPSHCVDKCYAVSVTGYTDAGFARLQKPMVLDGYRIASPVLSGLNVTNDRASFYMTIHEGRNRQIRRMCSACGMTVRRLCRIREGGLILGDLPVGQWRYLSEKERELI